MIGNATRSKFIFFVVLIYKHPYKRGNVVRIKLKRADNKNIGAQVSGEVYLDITDYRKSLLKYSILKIEGFRGELSANRVGSITKLAFDEFRRKFISTKTRIFKTQSPGRLQLRTGNLRQRSLLPLPWEGSRSQGRKREYERI